MQCEVFCIWLLLFSLMLSSGLKAVGSKCNKAWSQTRRTLSHWQSASCEHDLTVSSHMEHNLSRHAQRSLNRSCRSSPIHSYGSRRSTVDFVACSLPFITHWANLQRIHRSASIGSLSTSSHTPFHLQCLSVFLLLMVHCGWTSLDAFSW